MNQMADPNQIHFPASGQRQQKQVEECSLPRGETTESLEPGFSFLLKSLGLKPIDLYLFAFFKKEISCSLEGLIQASWVSDGPPQKIEYIY